MSKKPYAPREDDLFLEQINSLTLHHLQGCPQYSRIWPDWRPVLELEAIPFLHVGAFKHILFKTDGESIEHERVLKSSATTNGVSSNVVLDKKSSKWQAQSSLAILQDFVGAERRPYLILDSAKSLRVRGEVSARIAAAMTLRPLASEINFVLKDANDPKSMKWDAVVAAIEKSDNILIYGFTSILWLTFGMDNIPPEVRKVMRGRRFHFVHSGGWKKLEAQSVDRAGRTTSGPSSELFRVALCGCTVVVCRPQGRLCDPRSGARRSVGCHQCLRSRAISRDQHFS